MSFFQNYVDFMFREQSAVSISAMEAIPTIYRDSAVLTVFFVILFLTFHPLVKLLFPIWYKNLEEVKRRELPSYAICLIHHFILVPIAFYNIYNDYILPEKQWASRNYALVEGFVSPLSISYLLADTLCFALPELFKGKIEFMLHHIVTLTLVLSTLYGPGHLNRFIPHLLTADSTAIVFNMTWLIRVAGVKEGVLITVLEALFALLFLLFRVIHLTVVFASFVAEALGALRYIVVPLALLQWYWFSLIVKRVMMKLTGAENPKKKSKNT